MRDGEGLETDEDSRERVETNLKSFLRETKGGTIVLVGHGDLIWWLTRRDKHGEKSGLRLKNGEIADITSYIQK